MNKFKQVVLLLLVAAFPLMTGGHDKVPLVEGEFVALYRAVDYVAPGHFPMNQGAYGTCVAFGHAGAVDIVNAIDFINGDIPKWEPASKDSLYAGSRNEAYQKISGSYSQGSNGYGATRWLKKWGGVLYEKQYSGVDLSDYSIPRCKDWGASGNGGRADGLNGPLDKEAAKNPVGDVALVKTPEELDAAIENGCPVTICSGQGFTSQRDKDGFCRASGVWPHCMVIVGRRGEGRKGYCVLNSWGRNWVSGPKYRDQPDGSFYVEPSTILRILNADDSWAIAGKNGFKKQKLQPFFTSVSLSNPKMSANKSNEPASYKEAYQMHVETGKPLLVFTGASWCAPCRNMKNKEIPKVDMSDAIYFYLDVDSDPELADKITGNSPTVPVLTLYYNQGEKSFAKRLKGAQSAKEIRELIDVAFLQSVR